MFEYQINVTNRMLPFPLIVVARSFVKLMSFTVVRYVINIQHFRKEIYRNCKILNY